jgi:hypothetical protein
MNLRGKAGLWLIAIFSIITYAMVQFPVLWVACRIEPTVMGLPFFMFWCLLWYAIFYIGLLVAFKWDIGGDE